MHGGGPGVEKIAAQWSDRNGVHQVVCKPDWQRHGRAALFRRKDALLDLLPKGVIAFPGGGITGNLVDKAGQRGIPVVKAAAYRRDALRAKDLLHPAGSSVEHVPGDVWRARLYNQMLGQVGRTLDHWSPHLSLQQKQSLLRALDWYHTRGVYLAAAPRLYGYEFPQIDPGTWPAHEVSLEQANAKFAELEAVK